jgi:hypothetical protein
MPSPVAAGCEAERSSTLGFRFQPLLYLWPCVLERIGACAPVMWDPGISAMCRAHFAGLPGRTQARQEVTWRHVVYRRGDRIERAELLAQCQFGRLRDSETRTLMLVNRRGTCCLMLVMQTCFDSLPL